MISKPRTVTSRKIKPIHLEYVYMWMSNNPELTAQCILQKLETQCGVQVSGICLCSETTSELVSQTYEIWTAHFPQECKAKAFLLFSTADKQGHVSKCCLCGRINSGNVFLWTFVFSSTWLKLGSSACIVPQTQAFLPGECVGRNFLQRTNRHLCFHRHYGLRNLQKDS